MPIDAGLINALMPRVRSVQDYQDDYTRRDIQAQGLQRNALLLQEGQALQQDRTRTRMEQDGLNNALRGLGGNATPEQVIAAARGVGNLTGYDFADAQEKAWLERQKSQAAIGKDNAETAKSVQARKIEADGQVAKLLQQANNPSEAAALVRGAVANGYWTQKQGMAALDGMPTDLTKYDGWRKGTLAGALAPKDLLPTNGHVGLGGSMGFTSTDPWGRVTMMGSQPITQSADSQASERAAAASRKQSQSQFDTRLEYDKGKDTAKAGKPLPAPALKMQQESLDAIGIASSINADLAGIEKQISDGKLSFGPVSNLVSAGLNAAGQSTENSRNFASFKSTLERLRNESLRLNAGVQTDGDAQRAWAELFQNINDTELVKQRLGEIQNINKRGTELHRLRVDSVRSNYGAEPLDSAAYSNQPAAVGASPKPAAKSGPAVGVVENGYRFKGGDPSKQSSWEKQ